MQKGLFVAFALGLAITLTPATSAQQLQIKFVSVTSPVSPGDDATITIQTAPNASCMISVIYKSGPSRAQGLYPQTADTKGRVSWTWRVGTRTTPGRWPVIITCSVGGRQGTLETSFVVR